MAARAEPASPAAPLAAASPGLPPRGGVRLRALVLIRWVAVAGQLFTAATVHWGLGFTLPLLPVGGAIALSALLNLAVSLGRPASARIDDREATIFLAFDIVQLAAYVRRQASCLITTAAAYESLPRHNIDRRFRCPVPPSTRSSWMPRL